MSIAEKFEVIADAVYEKGVADQKAVSVDWDIIQNKGNRQYWQNAFAYWGSGDINPKYMIKPTAKATTGAQSMFQGSYVKNIDWSKFDFSECTTLYTAFNSCAFLESIDIDLAPTSTMASMWNYMFSGGINLKRIQKIVTKLNQTYTSTFYNCNELEEVRFAPYDADAGIGIGNDISFADSPKLTRGSLESILLALAPVDGKTLTFSTELGLSEKMNEKINCQISLSPSDNNTTVNVWTGEHKITTSLDTGGYLTLSDSVGGLGINCLVTIKHSDGTTTTRNNEYMVHDGDVITSIDYKVPSGYITEDSLTIDITASIRYWYSDFGNIGYWNIIY